MSELLNVSACGFDSTQLFIMKIYFEILMLPEDISFMIVFQIKITRKTFDTKSKTSYYTDLYSSFYYSFFM